MSHQDFSLRRADPLANLPENGPPGQWDLICFSHLRWDFVFQRPQHLLTRFARTRRVFFFEEPVFDASTSARLITRRDSSGVTVVVPCLPDACDPSTVERRLRGMLDTLITEAGIHEYVSWYYTPMARSFSDHLMPAATVYDCMDELSGFAGAPIGLRDAEVELLSVADVVFTGGQSLFEAKRERHASVHACPSSVDVAHFARARQRNCEPEDQRPIGAPRIGYFGVIDERLDIALLDGVAALRPDWQFVMVGPVVKVDPAALPRRTNIHYLGAKSYDALPDYIAGWSVAMLPFARNDATRFISPTKTPEYLAAGRPVVSTSIRDVVRPYGDLGLAAIADTPDGFVAAIERLLAAPPASRIAAADAFLAQTSWDATFRQMSTLIDQVVSTRARARRLDHSLPSPRFERAAQHQAATAKGLSDNV